MSGGSHPISSSRPTTISRSARLSLQDEARLRLDEMRILIALGERLDRHCVAADLARERREIFGRGDHAQRRRRRGRGAAPRSARDVTTTMSA